MALGEAFRATLLARNECDVVKHCLGRRYLSLAFSVLRMQGCRSGTSAMRWCQSDRVSAGNHDQLEQQTEVRRTALITARLSSSMSLGCDAKDLVNDDCPPDITAAERRKSNPIASEVRLRKVQ